ncbi:hypothetical protein NQ152_09450 [Microbacterium sp. zg.B48]|uniref:hypothetical protein n=1 Tax=unclassified Microbacterium TaxID=2609290 RepID=UPI00214B398E|nr:MULTISPECIES: hypothetical protein [unclassified Microbacterium]MCR2763733.1 hypothetical protein [Microbacterium sp. zg.B48]MCR2809453.1 hypothetical protein [Microbacterium sp. zg.B185]WIM20587.1 hypothetical protein QNO12_07290 [Microbacterium sp. zg-B185]
MPQRLIFTEAAAAVDALTFAGRTARVGDGAVRLRAVDGTLVMTSAPFAPRGLLDATPTVLAMRTVPVDPELICDVVVDASQLVPADDDAAQLLLPDVGLSPSWTGVTPPRGGWVQTGTIGTSLLAARAQWGITAVAEALPDNPGEDAVRAVRAAVWGVPDDALGGLPLGVAFAAFTLGFIVGEEEGVLRTGGAWTRLTLRRGHVLLRGPARVGMTDVRTTGAAA